MDIRAALKSQYHAALKTLHEVIAKCPDAMWDDSSDGSSRFWRVAYHTLFFAHFYLQQSEEAFRPWSRHRDEAHVISTVSWENNRPPKPCEPFTRDDLLEYWRDVDGMIDAGVDALDLTAAQSGFPWVKMPTLEHQILNIRHIQHHAAALSSRLRRSAGVQIGWVAKC
jgi:hypothetical protein